MADYASKANTAAQNANVGAARANAVAHQSAASAVMPVMQAKEVDSEVNELLVQVASVGATGSTNRSGLTDNRAQAIAQRRLLDTAANSVQAKRLQAVSDITQNSKRATLLQATTAVMNSLPRQSRYGAVQRKVFFSDINEEPMDEGAIRAWYGETFGQEIPPKLRNGGLRLLLASSSSVMLNSFTSDPNNFLDLIALTMTEVGNAGDKRIGSAWLDGRREQIEKEAAEAALDSFDPSGLVILIDDDAVKVYIDTHQDKHQHPASTIYGPWQHKRGTQFAPGKDAGWHAKHTAETLKDYALNLLKTGELQEGGKVIPAKKPLEDGYIYDAAIMMIRGVIYITYHCNPVDNEG